MSEIKDGWPGALPPVEAKVPNDMWENAIRAYGVVAACEWFGHAPDSEFTKKTIEVLRERKNPLGISEDIHWEIAGRNSQKKMSATELFDHIVRMGKK